VRQAGLWTKGILKIKLAENRLGKMPVPLGGGNAVYEGIHCGIEGQENDLKGYMIRKLSASTRV
jgi:hypothetical protein